MDNAGHAVLNAGRLKAFFGARCTKDAQFGWKRQKTQIGFAFGQRLYLLDDLHAGRSRFVTIFLATGHPAGIAAGTVFVID